MLSGNERTLSASGSTRTPANGSPSRRTVLLVVALALGLAWTASVAAPAAAAKPAETPAPAEASAAPSADAINPENVALRGSLDNARLKFQQGTGHVAFLGGSITEMEGYRPMVCEILQTRFPDTKFEFTNAGIASTCSTTGAFRLKRDVLDQGPVDLLLVEFAVNDDQDAAHARRECIRGMEGIIRHLRTHNPQADVVMTFFVNPEMLELLQQGRVPVSIAAHQQVARRYGVSTIHLAREVAERVAGGRLTWQQYGGTHPAPAGNRICAAMIDSLLGRAWAGPSESNAVPKAHSLPEPLDPNNYEHGRLIDPAGAQSIKGFRVETPDWSQLAGACRSRYAKLPLICAEAAGDELLLNFQGRAVGAFVLAGPDAGAVEARIDGGPPRRVDLYHRFSAKLHYPRTVIFDADLPPGEHTLRLRVVEPSNPKSHGHAVRIMQFVAN